MPDDRAVTVHVEDLKRLREAVENLIPREPATCELRAGSRVAFAPHAGEAPIQGLLLAGAWLNNLATPSLVDGRLFIATDHGQVLRVAREQLTVLKAGAGLPV